MKKLYRREAYLRKVRPFYHSDLIKVITGIRRCGKSCLLETIMEELRESGVPPKDILYINLDTRNYLSVKRPEQLAAVIDSFGNDGSKKYLFVDEVQNVNGFEQIINAYREEGNYSIFITGSNSYLLSGELVTKLTGRYVEILLFPLNFHEYLEMKRFHGQEVLGLAEEFTRYLRGGGFPQAVEFPDAAAQATYVANVMEQILRKDVAPRNKIRNRLAFDKVMPYLIQNFGSSTNLDNIVKYLKNTNQAVVKRETLKRYLDILLAARILYKCQRFDLKSRRSLRGEEKYYLADTGIYFASSTDVRIHYGPVLENVLYIYLLSQGYKVSVGRVGALECDFIAQRDGIYYYLQVAMSIADPQTEEREYASLEAIHDNYPKYLFTLDPLLQRRNGIRHLNLMEFLAADGELYKRLCISYYSQIILDAMKRFELVESLRIHVSGDVSEAVRLAAEDLARDIAAVTGGAVAPQVVEGVAARDGIVARVVPEEFPPDAVESCRLHSEAGNLLCIEGPDVRGAIYGVYAFSRKWLKVTPDYLWTSVPVRRLADWTWPEIRHEVASPAVRYRGVFINDEDLLTGWEPGGARHIDYPHYQTVLSRKTVRKLAETFLRMGYNLVIPSSFVDIRNPDEEMLLEEFARRGFILTMHHVEPLGVSAFAFDNYWKARGQVREFSYFSDPEALREVWRDSIRRWAKYPEVIWQLGLRGRSDRPFWEAGKAPEGDAERAAVISGAIREQQALVREITGDDRALCSTTLWAEGVVFNQRGLLELPPDVITVFADNCAGWRLQDDFFQSPVRPGAWYGVYCHHAVVIGTHLAQAIGARDFHRVLTEAMKTRPLCYAIFNASNVREFIHGLQATAEITAQPAEFSPDEFLRRWVEEHFSGCHEEICACYWEYFKAFLKNSRGVAYCTDGLMIARTLQALWMLRDRIRPPETGDRATYYMRLDAIHLAALGDMFPETGKLDEWLRLLERQAARFAAVHKQTRRMVGGVAPQEAALLYAQLVYPSGLDLHFCECERGCQLALRNFWASDFAGARRHLVDARKAFFAFERLLPQYLVGDFAHWYDRCTKVDFRKVKALVEEVLQGLS